MERIEAIKSVVNSIVIKSDDYLNDPLFKIDERADSKEKAFAMGIEQGSYDLALLIKAIIDTKNDEPPV